MAAPPAREPDGGMYVAVTADIAKGGVPRTSLVLDDRVQTYLIERRDQMLGQGYVVGSPTDPSTPWDYANRNRAASLLYQQVGTDLGIDLMQTERSHMWRTTLHTLYNDGTVPTAVLDSQFGNSAEIRSRHYTDPSDLSALKAAASR